MTGSGRSPEGRAKPRKAPGASLKKRLHSQMLLAARPVDEQFRLLVDSVVDYAIFILDPEGYIATWNKGAQRIKGYTADEIIGRHFSTFYVPEDVARHHPEEELVIAVKEGRYEEEGWRVRKDGTTFWANVVITALFDENGIHRGFAKVTRDITDRRMAEEARMQQIQETISRAFLREILFSVTEGRLRFCDDAESLPTRLATCTPAFPVSKTSLATVRETVLNVAADRLFPADRTQDLLTATSEAAMNAAVHASAATCQICADGLGEKAIIQAWIWDQGTGIDISKVHRATLERGFTTDNSLGHGFWLMLNTCDRIWLSTGPEGTTVVLEQEGDAPEPQWMSHRSYAGA